MSRQAFAWIGCCVMMACGGSSAPGSGPAGAPDGGMTQPSGPVPAAVVASSPAQQNAPVRSAAPVGPAVLVTSSDSKPLPGVAVRFDVVAGGGTVVPQTQLTNAEGIASTSWTLGPTAGVNTMSATVASLPPVSFTTRALVPRATADRTDEVRGEQIHVFYVLPSDGVDHQLDRDGTLFDSVASFQRWLAGQTSGRRLRFDTFEGALDITFYRLGETDAQVTSYGDREVDELHNQLNASGLLTAGKVNAVYYDGGSKLYCGQSLYGGPTGAVYLHGAPPGYLPCDTTPFAAAGAAPAYLEFLMLHEIVHSLNFVDTKAPHHNAASPTHVNDSNHDLMYAGSQPWSPDTLDVGHDDYYGEHVPPGVRNLADNPFLMPP